MDDDAMSLAKARREQELTDKIKDSGTRREFKTGAVRDMPEGKGRMDLLPWALEMRVKKPELVDTPYEG